MVTDKIDKDIQDDANRFYPKDNQHSTFDRYTGYIQGRMEERAKLQANVIILRAWMEENRPHLTGLGAFKSLLDNLIVGELPKIWTDEDIIGAYYEGYISEGKGAHNYLKECKELQNR